MDKPIKDMTHEEKMDLLRKLKEDAEEGAQKMQDLLAWFLAATKRDK